MRDESGPRGSRECNQSKAVIFAQDRYLLDSGRPNRLWFRLFLRIGMDDLIQGMDADEQPGKLPQESIRTSTILRLASISIRFADE